MFKKLVLSCALILPAISAHALILPTNLKVGHYDIFCDSFTEVNGTMSRPVNFASDVNVTSDDGATFLIKGKTSYNGMTHDLELLTIRKSNSVNNSQSIIYLNNYSYTSRKSAQILSITKHSVTELSGVMSDVRSDFDGEFSISNNANSNFLETKLTETATKVELTSDFKQLYKVSVGENAELVDVDFGSTITREMTSCIYHHSL